MVVYPDRNWVIVGGSIRFYGTKDLENFVVCKGAGCTPGVHQAPYELSVSYSDVENGKVVVRFGKDSRYIHEWKVPAFTDSFVVSKYSVHGWIGRWQDSDGANYILYGFTNEIPLGVVQVLLVDKFGNVYYAETPSSEDDFRYVGNVNDLLIAIKQLGEVNIIAPPKVAWWVPVLIFLGIVGGSSAAIAFFNAKKEEERRKALEVQAETINQLIEYCKQYPNQCKYAPQAVASMVANAAALYNISGGSHEGGDWISKVFKWVKQWLAPLAGIVATFILLIKLEVFRGLLDTIRSLFRRGRR